MRYHAQGVTLLELMTAIAVLAILAGIGVPAFTNIVRNSQIAAGSNDLVQALTLARSEALTRGRRVSVCAIEDEETCATDDGAAWQNGWMVFEDEFGDAGVLDDSDVVLQRWGPPINGLRLAGADEGGDELSAVTFTRNARAEFVAEFAVDKSGCKDEQKRLIEVNAAGRVSLTRAMCAED
jgi:type IV fimbrial biogenesis protein FimT